MIRLDYRNLSCPEPVIRAKAAIEAAPFETYEILCTALSAENLARLAKVMGFGLTRFDEADRIRLVLSPPVKQGGLKGIIAAMTAAIGAALVSSLCCVGPFIYLVFGVSAAGLSGLEHLAWLQWPMIALSMGLIGYGFWRLYFSAKPLCTGRFSRRQLTWLYWILSPVVLALLFYPFFIPWLMEFE